MLVGAALMFFVVVLSFAGLVCGMSFVVLSLISVGHLLARREPLIKPRRRQVELTLWSGVLGLILIALVVGSVIALWVWVESSWVYG